MQCWWNIKKQKILLVNVCNLETMEEILPNIEKYIIPESGGGNLLNLLNLNSEGGKK